MGDIRIDSEISMRPIRTIRPYIRNPRHNDRTIELLCKLIPKVGFNVPIVVDKNGIIVKGHARFIAAIRLGMEEVPCIVTHADADAIKADRIADNKISEYSEWITTDLVEEINDMEFDLSELGLPKISFDDVVDVGAIEQQLEEEYEVATEIEGTLNASDPEFEEYDSEVDELLAKPHYSVTCEKCGYHMIIPIGEVLGESEDEDE